MQLVSKAAFFCLWCFVFALPWDEAIILPGLGSFLRLVGVVASAVGILSILARRRIRQLTWFHVFAVLFVLWLGVSSFWSIDPQATRTRFMTSLQLVVLVWLIWEIAWSPERQRALLQAYVLGAGVAAVATVQNYLSGVTFAGSQRFAGLNQDPNELGVTLALAIPMAWYLSVSQPHRRVAWAWPLYLPLAMTALLLTASRGSFLAMLVALVIIPWTQGRLRLRAKVALYALVVGSFVLASTFAPDTSLERLRTTRADIETGYFGGRGAIWSAGMDVAREHLLAGVGAGAFGAAVAPTLHREMVSHQVLLALLVEDGIVGVLLFVATVAAAMMSVRQLPLLPRRFGITVLAVLAVGSLSLSLDYKKQFWFVLGMLGAQVARPTPSLLSSRRRPGGESSVGGTAGGYRLAAGQREESAQSG